MPKITKQNTADSQDSGFVGVSDDEGDDEGPKSDDEMCSGSEYSPEDDDGSSRSGEEEDGDSDWEGVRGKHTNNSDSEGTDYSDDEKYDESEGEVGIQGDKIVIGEPTEPNLYPARDGTIWTTDAPPTSRTLAENLFRLDPGPTEEASSITGMTQADVFRLFFDQSMLNEIVTWTNEHAMEQVESANQLKPREKKCVWKPVDTVELEALIGLLLLAGVDRSRKKEMRSFYSTDLRIGNPVFGAAIARDRLRDLMRYLRFRSRAERERQQRERKAGKNSSKLGPIEDLLGRFNDNLYKYFEPGACLTVDEMLVRFFGKVSFRVYMKSKPGKYGIKIWMIVDAETRYILKIQVYQGKMGGATEKDQGKRVVLELAEPYLDAARSITADNFFTSKELALELLQRKTTYIGTIRHMRKEVPEKLSNWHGREEMSSVFVFCGKLTLVSYIPKPKKRKNVLLLSSKHHSATTEEFGRKKPEIILHYNKTKGGVDTVDQMVNTYSCQRMAYRWPVKLFYTLLDMAALNSWIIWKWHKFKPSKPGARCNLVRSAFIKELSYQLIQRSIERRSLKNMLSKPTREALRIMGINLPEPPMVGPFLPNRSDSLSTGDCKPCRNQNLRRGQSRSRCSICRYFVCSKHKNLICMDCIVLEPEKEVKEEPLKDAEDQGDECSNRSFAITNISPTSQPQPSTSSTTTSHDSFGREHEAMSNEVVLSCSELNQSLGSPLKNSTTPVVKLEPVDEEDALVCFEGMPRLEPIDEIEYHSVTTTSTATTVSTRKRPYDQFPQASRTAAVSMNSNSSYLMDDEHFLFGMSVVPKLRRISEISKRKAAEVQMKIQGILLEHEPE